MLAAAYGIVKFNKSYQNVCLLTSLQEPRSDPFRAQPTAHSNKPHQNTLQNEDTQKLLILHHKGIVSGNLVEGAKKLQQDLFKEFESLFEEGHA